MDVSSAIDRLLGGVIPERIGELKTEWGNTSDRVRLLDAPGFLLQQLYGTVQVGEIALRQIWLIGYAAQKAIDAYSTAILLFELYGEAFDLAELGKIDGQAATDAAFDNRMRAVKALNGVQTLDDFNWPTDVPYPAEGMTFSSLADKAAYDLVCMAGGYIFLHEIRHAQLEQVNARPDAVIDEETECDRYALDMMVGRASEYAASSGYPVEKVLAKRLFGVLFAKLLILTLTPRKGWATSMDHPAVAIRIRSVLEAADAQMPDFFWPSIASLLAAFSRHFGLIDRPITFTSSRDLAFKFCDLIGQQSESE